MKKINLVSGKAVAIIKAYEHTYHVRFIKSGKFMEIKKSYLKTVYLQKKRKGTEPTPPLKNPQTTINF